MKSYIMFGIILNLLNKKRCTLSELADKFEVNKKTISRHVLSLSMSGVPIISFSGKNGGIELANTFSLQNNFLTIDEQNTLLSLIETNDNFIDKDMKEILTKKLEFDNITEKNKHINSSPNIYIDILPWYQKFKSDEKYKKLKQLCNGNKKLVIEYTKIDGSITKRKIEPYLIIYKESNFYLFAYCEEKNDYRLFKLSRIQQFIVTEETFIRRKIDLNTQPWNQSHFEIIELQLKYDNKILPELKDWLNNYTIDTEKRIIYAHQPYNNWLINKIFSFGNTVKVVSPSYVIQEIKELCTKVNAVYN